MNDIYTTQISESIESLFANLEQRISAEDMQRVRDAYALAAEAHKEQRRKTGEPYIIHPIAVARIIAEELELGANPVIAAFLHDVVEDTDYTMTMGSNGWTPGDGGYWYCNTAIDSGGFTPVLIDSCTSKNSAPDDNYNLSVEIMAEAIQSVPEEAVEDAWGVTVNNGTLSVN